MPRNEDNNLSSSASLRRPAAYEIVKEARCHSCRPWQAPSAAERLTSVLAYRASLKEPSRPFTPGLHQRSLLSTNDYSHRPSSAGLISRWACADCMLCPRQQAPHINPTTILLHLAAEPSRMVAQTVLHGMGRSAAPEQVSAPRQHCPEGVNSHPPYSNLPL